MVVEESVNLFLGAKPIQEDSATVDLYLRGSNNKEAFATLDLFSSGETAIRGELNLFVPALRRLADQDNILNLYLSSDPNLASANIELFLYSIVEPDAVDYYTMTLEDYSVLSLEKYHSMSLENIRVVQEIESRINTFLKVNESSKNTLELFLKTKNEVRKEVDLYTFGVKGKSEAQVELTIKGRDTLFKTLDLWIRGYTR